MANEFVQTMADAGIDAQSLSEFIYKPANYMVQRRLAPPINTLNHYLAIFNSASSNYAAASNAIDNAISKVNQLEPTIISMVNDAIDTAAVPSALITDAMINAGGVTQRSINMGIESIEDLISIAEPISGGRYYVKSYHIGANLGGGNFVYQESRLKSEHNGGTIISRTVPFGSSLSDFINGVGETDASGAGCFVKIITGDSVDAFEFGALPESKASGFDCEPSINAALKHYSHVIVNGGRFNIGSNIRIPDNTTLDLGANCEIYLKNGANDYIITNDDLINGNKNVRVIGAGSTLNGNKARQARNYVSPASDRSGYWGFGLWFVNAKDLVVRGLKVRHTESWGVAHWGCDGANFEDIQFEQAPTYSSNGDGVTGCSSNIVIKNISGFTNDDMVYIGAGGGTLGGIDMGMPQVDIDNIVIDGVYGTLDEAGTKPCFRGVRVSGRQYKSIGDIVVRNVKGFFKYNCVEAMNFWYADDPAIDALVIKNLTIERCERLNHSQNITTPVVDIAKADIDKLTIKEIFGKEFKHTTIAATNVLIQISPYTKVNVLNVADSYIYQGFDGAAGASLLRIRDNVNFLKMTNCVAVYKPQNGVYPTSYGPHIFLLRYDGEDFTNSAGTTIASVLGCSASSDLLAEPLQTIRVRGQKMLSIKTDCLYIAGAETSLKGLEGDFILSERTRKKIEFINGVWTVLSP